MTTTFNATSAANYERFMGRWSRSLAASFLDFVGVADGERVIDVGCGTGSLTFLLPDRADVRRIDAVDLSDIYLAAARARSRDQRIHFHRADAGNLPFAAGSFDRAVSLLLLHLVPAPEQVIREMSRVVRPAGIVAAAVWDFYGGLGAHRMFWDTIFALDPQPASVRKQFLIRPMTRNGEMENAFEAAGLTQVEATSLVTRFDYADFSDYWSPIAAGEGSLGKFFDGQPEPVKASMASAAKAAYLAGEEDGPRSFAAFAWACRGSVPDVGFALS